MKTKVIILLLTVLGVFCSNVDCAESVSTVDDQTIHSIVLHNGWLYFMSPNGDVILKERISDISSIIFPNDHSGGTDIIDVPEDDIRIYPNPVQETLFIESAAETTYKIYDLDGRCLMSGEGKAVSVSSLMKGTYLLQINNNTFKFIKQ